MKVKSLRQMMHVICMLFFLGGIVFLSGCEKEQTTTPEVQQVSERKMVKQVNIFDQYTFDIVVSDSGVVYPEIPDELFYQLISGYVDLPVGTEPSVKFKTIILEKIGNTSKELADKKGMYFRYTPEEVELYESEWGKTMAQTWYDYLVAVGIDPSLPVEEQNKILEERDNQQQQIQSRASSACIFTYVPHYYEWNTSENPNHYNWCGHASLKGVAKKHGTLKNLTQIHNAFCNNSSSGYCTGNRCASDPGSYCANLSDLFWMADNTNGGSWNYNYPSSITETIGSLAYFYQRAKDGIDNNKPLIIPSTFLYSYGHFYAVVGYETYYNTNGTINYNTSQVYLRNVADPAPSSYYWDEQASASNFYSLRTGNQVLFVRPGLYV